MSNSPRLRDRKQPKSAAAPTEPPSRWTLVVLVVVLALIGGGVGYGLTRHKAAKPFEIGPGRAMPQSVVEETAQVPQATLQAVGAPLPPTLLWPTGLRKPPKVLSYQGKPWVLFASSDYCSYCGVERWILVQALSRFGHFSGLLATDSSPQDNFPDIQSFSFYKSTYTSDYLYFSGIEIYNNVALPAIGSSGSNGYYPLEQPSNKQQQIINKYDTLPLGPDDGLPFLDMGNRYFLKDSQFSPQFLHGLTVFDIAKDMSSPTNPVGKRIDGAANVLTGALCLLTHGQPATTCQAPQMATIIHRYEHPPAQS